MNHSLILVYITVKDKNQARAIGKALVREKYAACANIIDRINSFYFWEGSLCDDNEAALIVKTRKSLLDRLIKRVKELHTYSVPCIVALPIVGGNPDFLKWVQKETERNRKSERENK
jgi:periplasmic divalent cation tolerance protein